MAKPAQVELKESAADLELYYRQMLEIRAFETRCNQIYRQGKAGGYLHVYIGMEATGVGWLHAIKQGYDNVMTAYRDHAQPLVLGSDPVRLMAEIMGRKDGYSKGKGGSMHLYDFEKRFYGGWGIVGGHTPLGAGLAFGSKYLGEDRVTLCFLGDGASNAGVFFESLNMAALWDLPVIYLIENNEFAMGTRLEYHASDTELHKRGFPFGIKHERVDGMDLLQVLSDARRIVDYVRKEQKPYLVEIMNYRFSGHGAADNDRQLYRTKEEEQENMLRDPIKRLEDYLRKSNLMTDEKMEAMQLAAEEWADGVLEEADKSPFPDDEEVYRDVYTDMEPEVGH
ncbi:MAG: pyruvate dehydrogenase (acetyl-transferring) E1 component subunit alpha [Armatimonadetes bacterium]|nr:pyruvate dehydrogenase (acetyl-transferring) E1 component subunit alpha [Armatimonadota bacterium]